MQEVEEMDKAHEEQQASLMVDMKKEMAAMQKKILVDCVRISHPIAQLQTMSDTFCTCTALFLNYVR